MKTALEETLLQALLELERAAQPPSPEAPRPDWPRLWTRIDELTAQLPPDADPRLRHYLRQKSYQKARLFLQGREAENQTGQCRRS
ncbi:MAG TPA: hypothetical protein VFB55_00700 [Verrucomicrobiae bacterium]|nr:hypothetical protein [Verrucomicrobiae bacterium]